MGEKSNQIEQHIREQREELGDNINELQEKVKDVFDWRSQFEQHPGTMLGIAVGGGLLLSTLIGRGMRSRRSDKWFDSSSSPSMPTEDESPDFDDGHANYNKKQRSEWEAVKTALIGVATTKLGTVINSLLPGFDQEYGKARSANSSYRDQGGATLIDGG